MQPEQDGRLTEGQVTTSRTELELLLPKPGLKAEFREKLLESYANFLLYRELTDWLRDLGQIPPGTIEGKIASIRRHARFSALLSESLPRQTIFYLSHYDGGILSEICQELRIDTEGSKETLLGRIYYEVGCREGWLDTFPKDGQVLIEQTLLPILKSFDYEKDYYKGFWDETSDLFRGENVPLQPALAHGSASIVVLIPDFLQDAHVLLFQEELRRKGLELS